MGRPNIALINQDTMLTPFFGHGIPEYYVRPLFLFVLVAITVFVVWRFLESDMGLAMRATGANPRMARAQGDADGPPDLSRHGHFKCPRGARRLSSLPRPTALLT